MALDGKLFHIGKHFNESRRINRNLDMRILRTFDDTDASGEDAGPKHWVLEVEGFLQSSVCPAIDSKLEVKDIRLTSGLFKPIKFDRDLPSFYRNCWCLRIGSAEFPSLRSRPLRTYFLILKKTGRAQNEFQRVGLGSRRVELEDISEDVLLNPVWSRLRVI